MSPYKDKEEWKEDNDKLDFVTEKIAALQDYAFSIDPKEIQDGECYTLLLYSNKGVPSAKSLCVMQEGKLSLISTYFVSFALIETGIMTLLDNDVPQDAIEKMFKELLEKGLRN